MLSRIVCTIPCNHNGLAAPMRTYDVVTDVNYSFLFEALEAEGLKFDLEIRV